MPTAANTAVPATSGTPEATSRECAAPTFATTALSTRIDGTTAMIEKSSIFSIYLSDIHSSFRMPSIFPLMSALTNSPVFTALEKESANAMPGPWNLKASTNTSITLTPKLAMPAHVGVFVSLRA